MVATALSLSFAVAAALSDPASLATFAQASPRPAVCRASAVGADGQLWSFARGETTRRYCLLLARGYTRLDRAPKDALALAHQAALLLPSAAEPSVLAGRSQVRLSEWQAAYAALAKNVTAPGRSIGDVAALRELGIAAAFTGRIAEAAAAYQALVPRVRFTEDRVFTKFAVIEAAAVLMAQGPQGLADAALYLSEMRRQASAPGLDDLIVAFLALAWDRSGKIEQAEVLLRELDGPWALQRFASSRDRARLAEGTFAETGGEALPPMVFSDRAPMILDGELHAALGCAALRKDPMLARDHLSAYLRGPGGAGPYGEWARARLSSLAGARSTPP